MGYVTNVHVTSTRMFNLPSLREANSRLSLEAFFGRRLEKNLLVGAKVPRGKKAPKSEMETFFVKANRVSQRK